MNGHRGFARYRGSSIPIWRPLFISSTRQDLGASSGFSRTDLAPYFRNRSLKASIPSACSVRSLSRASCRSARRPSEFIRIRRPRTSRSRSLECPRFALSVGAVAFFEAITPSPPPGQTPARTGAAISACTLSRSMTSVRLLGLEGLPKRLDRLS
jgi:hypothetical protein